LKVLSFAECNNESCELWMTGQSEEEGI